MNLLEETIIAIKMYGHTIDDISFIGSADGEYSCTWEEFAELANSEYDDGLWQQDVAIDLIIQFSDDGRLYRIENDGSEEWEYAGPFRVAEEPKPIRNLFGVYDTLDDLNEINPASGSK